MKYLKITYKSKHHLETKYLNANGLKNLNFNHKNKHVEIEVNGLMETGFIKTLNLSSFEMFLTCKDAGVFQIEVFELEEEAS